MCRSSEGRVGIKTSSEPVLRDVSGVNCSAYGQEQQVKRVDKLLLARDGLSDDGLAVGPILAGRQQRWKKNHNHGKLMPPLICWNELRGKSTSHSLCQMSSPTPSCAAVSHWCRRRVHRDEVPVFYHPCHRREPAALPYTMQSMWHAPARARTHRVER